MTFDKNTKEITVNRGDRVVLQKEFVVNEESTEFYLTLTSEDTRIGDVISKAVTYWYEVEYNGDQTLIGYGKKEKAKKFILLPEAPNQGGIKSGII